MMLMTACWVGAATVSSPFYRIILCNLSKVTQKPRVRADIHTKVVELSHLVLSPCPREQYLCVPFL